MFSSFSFGQPINLKQILADAGVQLLFTNSYNISNLFASSAVTHIGELDFSTVSSKDRTGLFNGCNHLVSIDKLVLPIGQTTFNNWFTNCTVLEHIIIEGEIGADISFQWSPLSGESIGSVVSHLSDSAAGKTVTFKLSAVNSAFETAEGAADGSASEAWAALIATKSNWTISCV
jgi:hypothetical protein